MLSTKFLPTLFLLIGAFVSLYTARYALTRTTIQGHRHFALFMGVLAIWLFGYAMEFVASDPAVKLFWAKTQYLGIPYVTPLLVLYLAQYRGVTWFRPWVTPVILAIPGLTGLIIWVRTEWIWSSAELVTLNNLTFYSFTYGWWFYVNLVYAYIFHMFGVLLLLSIVRRSPTLTLRRGGLLLAGVTLPLIGNALYILGIDLLPGIDWTPFAIVTFGIATALVMFEFRWLDLTPIASSTALESLPDSVLLLDIDNQIRALNSSARHFYNIQTDRPSLLNVRDLLPPVWWREIEAVPLVDRATLELADPDQFRHYELRLAPVFDQRNRLQGRLLLARDITTRKTAQLALAQREAELAIRVNERTAELRAANDKLTQAAKLKDEFLASMSHELRTPLNAVIGTAEAMREQVYGGISDRQEVALGRIEQSAHHLLSLINDILDVSKIQSGQFRIHLAPSAVQDIGEASINVVRSAARSKGVNLSSTYDITHPILHVDERRIRQVLINLLANAVKFTPSGGSVRLDVYDAMTARTTFFVVSDTGIGIAEADREKLFEPFVQLDASLARRYEGTGLGLALAQQLTRLHGGSISVRSTRGKGSTFSVAIPWDVPVGEEVVEDDLKRLFERL